MFYTPETGLGPDSREAQMEIEFFQTMSYAGSDHGTSWPASPSSCNAEESQATYSLALDQCAAALDAGFDSLNFAEHHYSPKQLTPNPIIFAAVAGQRFPDTKIGVFGTNAPINNPVRVAEEYAMLDNLLAGRLRIAMLRGTPNEYLTYFDNPWESREKSEEATLLLKACWTEPEPFGWEGRYYRYRNIAVWPRVVQTPCPRILISANSPDGAVFAGTHGFDIGFSYLSIDKCRTHIDLYHASAAAAGWQPTSDNVQYRHWIWVDDTDEEAERVNAHYAGGGLLALFDGATIDKKMAIGKCGAAMAGVGRNVRDTSGLAFPAGPPPSGPPGFAPTAPFVGTPDTVLARIAEVSREVGAGRMEFHVGMASTPIPHDLMLAKLKMLGDEVVPVVHQEAW